jgi:hypothetical protein
MRTAEIDRLNTTEARAAEAPAVAIAITRLLSSSFHDVLRVFKMPSLSAQQRLNYRPYRLAFAIPLGTRQVGVSNNGPHAAFSS